MWQELLRAGVRGGTTREILSNIEQNGNKAEFLNPSQLGVKDHIDLWCQVSSTTGTTRTRKLMMWGSRAVKIATGVTMIPYLSLAMRKVW